MSNTPNLDYLKEEVRKLHALLDDPHPGLFTWREAYADQAKVLMEFWSDSAETVPGR